MNLSYIYLHISFFLHVESTCCSVDQNQWLPMVMRTNGFTKSPPITIWLNSQIIKSSSLHGLIAWIVSHAIVAASAILDSFTAATPYIQWLILSDISTRLTTIFTYWVRSDHEKAVANQSLAKVICCLTRNLHQISMASIRSSSALFHLNFKSGTQAAQSATPLSSAYVLRCG